MRPLNRPMFRYGGPIKEGVMSGIREPHVGGGRIGFKDGTQKGGVFPAGGKMHRFLESPLGGGIAYGIPGALADMFYTPGNLIGRAFGFNPGWSARKDIRAQKDKLFGKDREGRMTDKEVDVSNFFLPFSAKSWRDEKKGPTAAEKITETNPWKDKYEALVEEHKVPKKSAEETRAEKLQRYRDIVDIKGMNREAAAKSLIEASRLINESQDFKGDIRSGKLINRIIQGTSKAYDKPADMRRAIDTLILKGEIQKDLSAETDALEKEYKRAKIAESKKALKGNTPAQYIAQLATRAPGGKPNSVTVAAGYKSAGIIPKATITDTIVDEWIDDKAGRTEIDYVKEVISKADGFVPGLYVVGDRAVIFDGTTYEYDY